MNTFDKFPRPENINGSNPPPPAFDDAVYADIFNSTPLPTPEELTASAEQKRKLEEGFAGDNREIQKLDAQKARSERLTRDQKAANDIGEQIRKAA